MGSEIRGQGKTMTNKEKLIRWWNKRPFDPTAKYLDDWSSEFVDILAAEEPAQGNPLKGKRLTDLKDPVQGAEFLRRLNELNKHMDCPHWNGEVCDKKQGEVEEGFFPITPKDVDIRWGKDGVINCIHRNGIPIKLYASYRDIDCPAHKPPSVPRQDGLRHSPLPWKIKDSDQGSAFLVDVNNRPIIKQKPATYDEEGGWEYNDDDIKFIVDCCNSRHPASTAQTAGGKEESAVEVAGKKGIVYTPPTMRRCCPDKGWYESKALLKNKNWHLFTWPTKEQCDKFAIEWMNNHPDRHPAPPARESLPDTRK